MGPSRSHANYQTLSGFWEVNGVRAHCLLDSGCEGVMISPDFTQAMGLVTFKLEQPIALQLACISSKSKVNYGAHSTILFGNQRIEEIFDVMNINYYDVILGTPFMRWLGITLDFTSPGSLHIGDYIVPRNLLPATSDNELNPTAHKQPVPKASK